MRSNILIGILFYFLSLPATFIHPILGIACFLIANVSMFWNMNWGLMGGTHYHTHYHTHGADNQDVVTPQNVTQATEHRVENEEGQSVSVRKLTQWH